MSATTVNAFPPLHAFNSSRSWALATIVLVHLGFFWGLTHGVSVYSFKPETGGTVVLIPSDPPKPPPSRPVKPDDPTFTNLWVPEPLTPPELRYDDPPTAPVQTAGGPPPPPTSVTEGPGSGPLILEPEVDARFPFTEPEYPVAEIRQGHEGVVLLALQILPNGRVGAVRIDKSSGYLKLDESAAREARRWRMKPGTSDGTAMPMWKRVPIKFQLKN